MKVYELFEAAKMMLTPPEHQEEWDVVIPKKIREIARKYDLTVRINAAALQVNKKFAGRGFGLLLKPIGRTVEKPANYDKFWPELIDTFHDKYDISIPNQVGSGFQRLTLNSKIEKGTKDLNIWMHIK